MKRNNCTFRQVLFASAALPLLAYFGVTSCERRAPYKNIRMQQIENAIPAPPADSHANRVPALDTGFYYSNENGEVIGYPKNKFRICGGQGTPGVRQKDYQLDMTEKGIVLWDGSRIVGFIPYGERTKLDTLIANDNL